MFKKKLLVVSAALCITGAGFCQVHVRAKTIELPSAINNPYDNLNVANGNTKMKQRFEQDETISGKTLTLMVMHWENSAPDWINLNVDNGYYTVDMEPGRPSYSSGTFFLSEGTHTFTFSPYGSYQHDYEVACQDPVYDVSGDYTATDVATSEPDCNTILIGSNAP